MCFFFFGLTTILHFYRQLHVMSLLNKQSNKCGLMIANIKLSIPVGLPNTRDYNILQVVLENKNVFLQKCHVQTLKKQSN